MFWGESVMSRLRNRDWSGRFSQNLKIERKATRIKRGVAYSLITSDIDKEFMVSIVIGYIKVNILFLFFLILCR